ncbi:uncharacterized protein EV154DRAFT_494237 [Mucor mucedo]|uniref:uncharacterized protein n=1 Tax=Mucor mucedo TaxID=29922 RepID=UPI00221F8134|nr:uncharacterized protein EV154DRAFT_494237 [Mucor mucedo]KAI7895934.1 hypothetical protein EV154DRAFT_494237 [Mucor mucedo]
MLLDAEYEKLAQLRLDQCESLKKQWDVYRNEQRLFRKKDIEKRQVEFDEELSILDRKRRMKWKNNSNMQELSKDEMRIQLSEKLKEYVEQDTDEPIITLPTDLLEYFWLLDIEIPIMKSELLDTISLLDSH